MERIRLVVHGATGRMGGEVLKAASREPDLELVGAVCRQPQGNTLALPDSSGAIPLSTDLEGLLEQTRPTVLVDFTSAEACLAAARVALGRGVRLVTGTTGLGQAQLQELEQLASERGLGAIVAPNFALGAVLLLHLARLAAPHFQYADIVEAHHEAKEDAPSGTALALARAIAAEGRQFQRNVPHREALPGTRGGDYQGVAIHSIRMPGRLAHHQVTFGIAGQTLSLQHDTVSRECYMPGVLLAIREVVQLKGLVVGLEKLLGL
ncbi:MAG: 4-hydroxy-tetrahydrodipicolinate reductase [Dehalococcoidia bacterium]